VNAPERLLAPGPVAVPAAVLAALALPVVHHRTPAFVEVWQRARRQLATIMGVSGDDTVILSGSGTAAFEAVLLASVPRGGRVLALCGGKFGERWALLARTFGFEVAELDVAWGETFDADVVAARVRAFAPDAVTVVHSETSTGTLHDIEALARAVRAAAPDTLVLVDAVTSLAAMPLHPHAWDIDALVAGSQKGVMLPPGLGFVWLSERAWNRAPDAATRVASFSLDLHRERVRQRDGDTTATPATSLVVAADVAFAQLLTTGIERRAADLQRRNRALLAAGVTLGMQPLSVRPSPAVAAMLTPASLSAPAVTRALAARGWRIAGGQDHLTPRLLRPSALGDVGDADVVAFAEVLEQVVAELGGPAAASGVGAAAARTVLEAPIELGGPR
jgi:aspartate aminotransferase-like enzyme